MGVKETSDGSVTFYSEKFEQTYHSVHGAKTESERVFIELGFDFVHPVFQNIHILEIGFGTGLNAFLTKEKAENENKKVNYLGLEAFPLSREEYLTLPAKMHALHQLEWNEVHTVSPWFSFCKKNMRLEEFTTDAQFHLIYFDAFSPEAQPELWTEAIFRKMYNSLDSDGVLTTYCSKSIVQKNLRNAGFEVEKHKGPPHKREVIRAIKK